MEQVDQKVQDERMWGMFCHLSAFSAFFIPFGSFLGPLVIWSIKKDEFPFVDEQGKEVMNFNLSILIYITICSIFFFLIIPLFAIAALLIFRMVLNVIAAIQANNGETFNYPLSIKFFN